MTIDTFFNNSIPNLETNPDYGFTWPVNADIRYDSNYTPSYSYRYFMSLFGPRYKSTSSSSIGYYDFHQGADFTSKVSWQNQVYDDDTLYHIICMCDGTINDIIDSTDVYLETLGTGRSVKVKCDSSFRSNANWGPIYINYRHLSALDTGVAIAKGLPADSIRLNKGDTIGIVGESGITSNIHLHLSIQRYEQGAPGTDFKNMHVMRIFPFDQHTHLHEALDTAIIDLLHAWPDSALFRIAIPYNQVNIRRIEVKNQSFSNYFDFEDVSDSTDRDVHDIIPGFAMFAYPFNRGQSTKSYYDNAKNNLPIDYPGSPNRDTVQGFFTHIPITLDTPIYVMDMMVRNLPNGYDSVNFEIVITDIYGNAVRGFFPGAMIVNEGLSNANVVIYPNPGSGEIRIKTDGAGVLKLKLVDAAGRKVYEGSAKSLGSDEYSVPHLPTSSGVYLLSVTLHDGTVTQHTVIR